MNQNTVIEQMAQRLYVAPSPIREYEDLNSYLPKGMYFCGSNAVAKTLKNCPIGLAFTLLVEQSHANGDGAKQTLTNYNDANTYIRVYSGSNDKGIWTEWRKILFA